MTTTTAVKERPIIFSAPMVKAILSGAKSQTRRVVKPQPVGPVECGPGGEWWDAGTGDTLGNKFQPNMRLWVKEQVAGNPHQILTPVHYFADGELSIDERHDAGLLKRYSAMFCPRWASRITLEITDVRVQRVQDISGADAVAEGWPDADHRVGCCNSDPPCMYDRVTKGDMVAVGVGDVDGAVDWYADLWDSLNGKTHPWDSNPWVWALTFKRID